MDYFQSHIVSFILTWLFSVPLILVLIFATINFIFEKIEGVSRFYMLWLVICILLFTPIRYILLQIFVAIAYPFQSIGAFVSILILGLYIPIVFGILYIIGFALPMMGVFLIVGFKETTSKIRLWLSALAMPFVFLIGSLLFYLILPYAAYSTHWLHAEDVIRATNGPSEYFYRYAIEPFGPVRLPTYTKDIGFDNLSSKERLRSHVAVMYLGQKECNFFVYKSFPEEYKRKTGYEEEE